MADTLLPTSRFITILQHASGTAVNGAYKFNFPHEVNGIRRYRIINSIVIAAVNPQKALSVRCQELTSQGDYLQPYGASTDTVSLLRYDTTIPAYRSFDDASNIWVMLDKPHLKALAVTFEQPDGTAVTPSDFTLMVEFEYYKESTVYNY